MTTLDQLAADIRSGFENLDQHRIEVGRKLLEAQSRVRKGEASGNVTWEVWLEGNVQRSPRDVRRLISLAKAPDPAAALQKERATARAGMARSRAEKRTNVSPEPDVGPPDDGALIRRATKEVEQLRGTLVAIKDHSKRARALDIVDHRLKDVREDIAKRQRSGEIKKKKAA